MKYKISLRKRRLAIFLLISFLQSVVLPPVASALTSGPTAPEAMSFEPVDATDMVNLMTGDFTYNVPLLEVPGPEGGYPLSLSYHAGIKPLEDASWVGLGWNLSPGAINRAVNGYPDDHKDVTRTVEDRWQGGSTQTYSVGVGVGIPNGPQLGLDISVSNDTYRGFGGDIGLSVGIGEEVGLNASIGVSVGSSGFSAGPQVGFTTKQGYGLSAGFSTDFKGGSAATFGVSDKASRSALGISLSSNGVRGSFKAGGISAYQHNNNAGNISVSTTSGGIGIPVGPVIVNLGFRYTRYWMHETDVVNTNGTLYAKNSHPGALQNKVIQDEHVSFDSYSLHQSDINIAEHFDPDWVQGGSYPAYDNYSVSGQGISGNIQPYIFENGSLYRKQVRKGSSQHLDLSFYHMRSFNKDVNFRFVNDFSNTLQINPPSLNLSINNPSSSQQSYSVLDNTGYNSTDQHLAGSKHIEWYTNQQILNGNAPALIEYPGISTAERTTHTNANDLLDQMGGVSITNESGVTYHYALPVYSFGEYSYTRKEDTQGVESWNKQYNDEPYAYTWLLTAVTGPDYVDKNDNDQLDDEDWGYWTAFEYGKWTHDYAWRSPSTGTFRDINEESDNFSYGKKALYYLDAVRTRTHTALFVKDIRKDGKSVTDRDDGGFEPQQTLICSQGFPTPTSYYGYTELPVSTLRLDKILLFKNSVLEANSVNLNTVRQHGSMPGDLVGYFNPCTFQTFSKNFHLSDNVIDVTDMSQSAMAAVVGDAVKTIELDNDHYDLCPGTANSFNEFTPLYSAAPGTVTKSGKLTLKSIKYKGRNNSTIMPPLNFNYDYNDQTNHNFSVNTTSVMWIDGASSDWVGDIVKYSNGSNDYYALLTGMVFTNTFSFMKIGDNTPLPGHTNSSTGSQVVRTKNVPFDASKYDYWGYYKPDFTQGTDVAPSNIARNPTSLSVKNADAWSLRGIETSLGAKIEVEYENKIYEDNVWQLYEKINLSSVNNLNSFTEAEFTFEEYIDLEDAFSPGDVVTFTGYIRELQIGGPPIFKLRHNINMQITAVTSDKITVNNPFTSSSIITGEAFIRFMRSSEAYGNGIRAKSIAVKGDGNTRKTIYDYQGGCISYNPSSLEYYGPTGVPLASTYEEYFKEDLSFVIALARELPAPAVMYETVGISEEYNGVTVPGSKRYTFQVPKEDMVTVDYSPVQSEPVSGDVEELSKRTVTLKDKTSQIGNLLKVEVFNGQGLLANRTEYDYTDDEPGESETDYDAYNDQGIIHQAFHELRTKHTGNEDHRYIKGVVSVREEFPSILKSTTSYSQNMTTVTKNVEYDFYSGQLLTTEMENHKDEFYRQEAIPAYKKYTQLGLKVNASGNKHMLTQNAYSQTSEIDGWDGNILNIMDARATTWNNNWDTRTPTSYGYYTDIPYFITPKVWRKHKELVWRPAMNPDGTLSSSPNTTDQNINWIGGSTTSSNWETVSTVTRYDRFSKPLEEVDLDNNYASVKMGYDESLVIATNGKARFTEYAFSGAEDYDPATGFFGGEVWKGNGSVNSTPYSQGTSHTGHHILGLDNGEEGFIFKAKIGTDVEEFSARNRRYRASVWWLPNGPGVDLDQGRLFYRIETNNGSVLYTGTEVLSPNYDRKAGDWHQLNLDIEIPSGYNNHYLVVGVRNDNSTAYELYFDDFRFYPTDAPFKAYVYDKETDELTYILDENNMFTQFEYNDRGQLVKVFVETTENPRGKRLMTEHDYQYKRPLD